MKKLFFLVALLPLWAHSGSLYLCKAYSGGTFWSSAHCNQHSALIESIVNVPSSLPFDQQVKLAEQQRQPTSNTNTVTNTVITTSTAPSKDEECKALDDQVKQFDAMARQPQSGQTQDWITAEKRKARDRQFKIGC